MTCDTEQLFIAVITSSHPMRGNAQCRALERRTLPASSEEGEPGRCAAASHGGSAGRRPPSGTFSQTPKTHPPPATHRQRVATERPPCER